MENGDNMNIANILSKMHAFASTTKDDLQSVQVARVADRLAHQGPFERPLTPSELAVVAKFCTYE
jgi:hypothetical protein